MTPTETRQAEDRNTWLENRRKWIGASDVGAILGVSPYATAWDIWAEKTGKLEPFDNEATRMGRHFEPAVLDHAESKLGQLERNVLVNHESLPLGATLDARTLSLVPVEVKTSGIVGPVDGYWGQELTSEIPEHYLAQVHAQILCTGADMAYLFALLAGRGIVEFRIERSESICEMLGSQLSEWWHKHITLGLEPDRNLATPEVVRRMKRIPSKSIELSEEVAELWAEMEQADERKKKAESIVKQLEAQIIATLGDAESGLLPDGENEVTFFSQTRKAYTAKESTFRVLRVRKRGK